jgi:hypothetical protein
MVIAMERTWMRNTGGGMKMLKYKQGIKMEGREEVSSYGCRWRWGRGRR